MKHSRMLTAGLITLAMSTLAGCLVSAPPPPPARPVAYAYEEPIYHDGYVVQFDTAGLPYIYVGRAPRYIPRHHPRYPYLMQRRPGHAHRHPGHERRESGHERRPSGYERRHPGYARY